MSILPPTTPTNSKPPSILLDGTPNPFHRRPLSAVRYEGGLNPPDLMWCRMSLTPPPHHSEAPPTPVVVCREQKYECDICDKTFKSLDQLKFHAMSHTTRKRFVDWEEESENRRARTV